MESKSYSGSVNIVYNPIASSYGKCGGHRKNGGLISYYSTNFCHEFDGKSRRIYQKNGSLEYFFYDQGVRFWFNKESNIVIFNRCNNDTYNPHRIEIKPRKDEFKKSETVQEDPVNHPTHYNSHPSGIECIQITQHYDFCVGNAMKYLWRAGLKKDASQNEKQKEIEDLEKAVWYIRKKIEMLKEKK